MVWSLATVHHWADVGAGLAEVERVLAPGGRFVVLERRIADPHAGGVAGHGWTTDQRDAFAGLCASRGFTGVESGTHDAGTTLLSVFARRA